MDLLRTRDLPFLARRNYHYEFKHIVPWSVLAGLVEGHFASVVVAQSFNGGPLLIAVAAATPMAARVFSLIWGLLCIGRRKIPLLTTFATGVVIFVAAVAVVPLSQDGAVVFVALMAVAQVLLSGVVTVRSAVWKANYPRARRGRIAARLQRMRMLVSVVTVLAAAELCTRAPDAYRVVFPIAALLGLMSIAIARRIHIRGERSELKRLRAKRLDGGDEPAPVERYGITALLSPGRVIGQMARVLAEDQRFAAYCLAQFCLGLGNLMTIAVIVTLITRDLSLGSSSTYWISTGLIVAVPNLVMLGSVARWGRLFDRLGVLRMRVVNVLCWLGSLVFGFAAALVIINGDRIGTQFVPIAVLLLGVRAIGYGLGMGGGALAWNLGHLHFASPEQAEIYMGIHVSLTGVRGLIAPLLGIWLWNAIGWPVWVIAIGLVMLSEALFVTLAHLEQKDAGP